MTDVQQAAYGDATDVASDALGVLPRDNRNHGRKQEAIEAVTAATPGDAVLEVGCGSGLHTAAYSDRYDVTAVDISPGLLATTRERAPDARVLEADARDLPLPDDHVTAVVGTAILHHLPDARSALEEWCRVTRPGGSVTVVEPNLMFPKATLSALIVPEERHKRQMAPWHVREMLEVSGRPYQHDPLLYTPPWPNSLGRAYDLVDTAVGTLPGVRWLSQMQRIHLEVIS